jgi:hypothetical protein
MNENWGRRSISDLRVGVIRPIPRADVTIERPDSDDSSTACKAVTAGTCALVPSAFD